MLFLLSYNYIADFNIEKNCTCVVHCVYTHQCFFELPILTTCPGMCGVDWVDDDDSAFWDMFRI